MFVFSSLDPAVLVGVGLATIALTVSVYSLLTPKEDAAQSSAQGPAKGTDRSASQIGNCRIIPLSGISPDTLEEFRKLFPETKIVSNNVLLEELTGEVEDAETMGITPEEHFRSAIEAVRMNDKVMRRAIEETAGDTPAQPR